MRFHVRYHVVQGIDESHPKFLSILSTDGEFRIHTVALKKGERASLLEDLRMGTKQARASSPTAPQGRQEDSKPA